MKTIHNLRPSIQLLFESKEGFHFCLLLFGWNLFAPCDQTCLCLPKCKNIERPFQKPPIIQNNLICVCALTINRCTTCCISLNLIDQKVWGALCSIWLIHIPTPILCRGAYRMYISVMFQRLGKFSFMRSRFIRTPLSLSLFRLSNTCPKTHTNLW